MLNVQKFLKETNGSLEQLSEKYGIKVRLYPEDNVVMLNYDQIDSPKSDPIVVECRSLVLAMDTFELVSMKFPRFFNFGECPHLYEDFDLSSALVVEKADGSIVGFNYSPYTGRWEISTRSMYKAEGEHVLGGSFREKIRSAAGFETEESFQDWCEENLKENLTYIFEWVSPQNRIVTPYEKSELVLLGVSDKIERRLYTMDELRGVLVVFTSSGLFVRLPHIYPSVSSKDELVEMVNQLPDLQEGFIVWCQKTDRRMKMKSSNYLVAHRLRGENGVPTRKSILELVLQGEVDEFLCYFPEYSEVIAPIQEELYLFERQMIDVWTDTKHIQDQKEFAIRIKDFRGNSILFMTRRNGFDDPVQVFHELDINKKMRLLGC